MQSFIHGMNCAVAHLQFEAVLSDAQNSSSPQAGRTFTVTDPNPPITYNDLYSLLSILTVTPFRTIWIPPVPMLLISYLIEAYMLLPTRYPILRQVLPKVSGDLKHLQPSLFSICTHLFADNADAGKPVAEGGLGYTGILTTLEGMCQEVFEWNQEQTSLMMANGKGSAKVYRSSVSLAEEIQMLVVVDKK